MGQWHESWSLPPPLPPPPPPPPPHHHNHNQPTPPPRKILLYLHYTDGEAPLFLNLHAHAPTTYAPPRVHRPRCTFYTTYTYTYRRDSCTEKTAAILHKVKLALLQLLQPPSFSLLYSWSIAISLPMIYAAPLRFYDTTYFSRFVVIPGSTKLN